MRRRVVDRWRRHSLPGPAGGDYTVEVEVDGVDPLANDFTDEMQQALNRLPSSSRVALLVVVGELTHQEVSDLLGVPLGTVLSRVCAINAANTCWPWQSRRPDNRADTGTAQLPPPRNVHARLRTKRLDRYAAVQCASPARLVGRLALCGPTLPSNDGDGRGSMPRCAMCRCRWTSSRSSGALPATDARSLCVHRQVAVAAGVFLATGLEPWGAWDLINGVLQSGQTPVAQHAEPPRPTEGSSQFAQRRPSPPLQQISQTDAATSRNSSHLGDADPQAGQFLLPMFQDVAAMGALLKQKFEARQRSQSTLGAGGAFDPLPELDALEAPMLGAALCRRVLADTTCCFN